MSEYLTVRRLVLKTSICAALLLAVGAICIFAGPDMTVRLKGFFGVGGHRLSDVDYQILFHIRLPRIILAAVIGAALACSGVTLQAILRNPLADPYILGISSGAALGVAAAVTCGLSFSVLGGSAKTLFGFCGAFGTVWLVWFVGHLGSGGGGSTSLLLAGVVINALFSAVVMFLTSIATSEQVKDTALWLMGNLTDKGAGVLAASALCIIGGIGILFTIAQKMNVASLGQPEAKSLGVNVSAVKLAAFAVSAFITAVAVSLTGLIGFVGLIIPHAGRLIFGPDHRQLIPISAFLGAAFLVVADTIARSAFSTAELPVGVITAIAGGPFFLILLARYSRKVSWAK
jgi:iron complex transport system permease protein